MYADDILVISRTRNNLQILFENVLESLRELNLSVNTDKTCCTRIGPRFNCACDPVRTLDGSAISWVEEMRYLGGVYFL